jgi:predicted DNA-binding protein YlxM (UPF0122 family)|tara:strand:- start:750 stop:1211 length:462 start_codon:yes stop_codon:yes gene_type:complete
MNKDKKDEEVFRHKKKFKDDWRYVGCDDWRLDKLCGSYDVEDEMIDRLDKQITNVIPLPPQFSLVDWLEMVLTERENKIVYNFMWLGKSMDEIGDEMGYTRQRIWQIYKASLAKVGEICGDAEVFKQLFMGENSKPHLTSSNEVVSMKEAVAK